MNILIVNWRDLRNPLYGGAEIHIEKIASYLARKNNVTFLCSCFNGGEKDEVYNGVHYIRMGHEKTFNFSVYAHIRQIIKEYRIDIIIEDINKIPFYIPLCTRKPVLAVIPHIFGKTIFNQAGIIPAMYVFLAEKPIRRVYRNSYFEVISESTKTDLIRRGIKPQMIKVIECGIDDVFYNTEKTGKSPNPLIVYVGRLKKYKSVQHAIKAFDLIAGKYPQARMLIVGTGDYSEELKKEAGLLKSSDRIEFAGYVSEKEKIDILKRAWVSVYPSLIEGWGIVNIEANAAGTPVVCSNVPGLREYVKDGYSGFLYECGNVPVMYEKVNTVIESLTKDDSLIRNAVQWARRFDWEMTGRLSEEWILNMMKETSIDIE